MEGQTPGPPPPPQPPQMPPQMPPPQMPPGGGYMTPPPEKASGLAIASLILSIFGIVCCTVVPSAVGLILGIVEKGKISRGESSAKGAGMAKAGVILGIVGVAVGVIFWIAYVIFVVAVSTSTPSYTY